MIKKLRKEIENKALKLRTKLGGKIFAFPVTENDPWPKYAIVFFTDGRCNVFPDLVGLTDAENGINALVQKLQQNGHGISSDKDVHIIP